MSQKTCIMGIGGAGGRIISHIQTSTQAEASIVALDTDARSLYDAVATTKLQIGQERVRGESTSGDANMGRLAAEDDIELIRTLFVGTDLAMIVLGLGGGAGTGVAPLVLKAAREAGALTLCFATLSFDFEAEHRRSLTERGIASLRENSDALVLIPNQEIFDILGEGSLTALFERADALLGEAVSGIWRGVAERGYYNPDFSDVQAMLKQCGGACHLGYTSTTGDNRIEKALDSLGKGALLNRGRALAEARVALVNIMGGDDLTMKEIKSVRSGLAELVPEDCRILLSTVIDDSWNSDRVVLSILMSEEWVASRPKAPVVSLPVTPVPAAKGKGHRAEHRALPITPEVQPDLPFETRTTGRFKGSEPTIVDGEDFDMPTYQRRHIAIER